MDNSGWIGIVSPVILSLILTSTSSPDFASEKLVSQISHELIPSLVSLGDVSFATITSCSSENFKANGIKLISLTDFPTVVKVAGQIGYIKAKDKDIILQWAKDPASWGKKHGFSSAR